MLRGGGDGIDRNKILESRGSRLLRSAERGWLRLLRCGRLPTPPCSPLQFLEIRLNPRVTKGVRAKGHREDRYFDLRWVSLEFEAVVE